MLKLVADRPIAVNFVASCPGREQQQDNDAGEEEKEEEPEDEEQGDSQAAAPAEWTARQEQDAGGKKLDSTDFYIRFKTAFRYTGLARLKGAPLSIFLCLALHLDTGGVAAPGIETIMRETGYARGAVCSALTTLVRLGLVTRRTGYRRATGYVVNGYAWFGRRPAPALFEEAESKSGFRTMTGCRPSQSSLSEL